MPERRIVPFDSSRLSTERSDFLVDGKPSDFSEITTKSGFVNYRRVMVERDGDVLFDKIVIDPSEGVFVLPVRVNPEGKAEYLLVNEWKDVLQKRIYQIPQGRINANETKSEAAAREVEEETGYKPKGIVLVGKQIFDSAYMSLEQPFYLGIVPYDQDRKELNLDDHEDIEKSGWMSPEQIRRLPISDGKTTIGIALAERVLNPKLL